MLFVRQWLTDNYEDCDIYDSFLFSAKDLEQAVDLTKTWLSGLSTYDLRNIHGVAVFPQSCCVNIDHKPYLAEAERRQLEGKAMVDEEAERAQYERLHAKYGAKK